MTKVNSLIILLLLFSTSDIFSQTYKPEIDLFFISCWGDSLIPQGYELDIKKKQIYFVNPVRNYLDIKGGKPKYHMRFDKVKRTKIFDCFNKTDLSNLSQFSGSKGDRKYFTVRLILTNNDKSEYIIPDKVLPVDLRKLYETIIE